MPQLSPRGNAHAPQRGLGQRRLEAVDVAAQAAGIKGCTDRAPAQRGRRTEAMEVGYAVAVDELQRGLAPEELDHARPLVQEGAHARGIKLLAQLVAQVGLGQGRVFVDAGGARSGLRGSTSSRPTRRWCRRTGSFPPAP
jgi:hypothetical protein